MSDLSTDPAAILRRELPSPDWITAPDGHAIPVRRFGLGGTRRPVVLVHGLQSHSGWFSQAARHMASLGFPVYAFDRCGSGVSPRECDPGPGCARLVEEIDAVVEQALAEHGRTAAYLLAYCFGALPALLYAALHRPELVAGLVLVTPALYTRADLPLPDRALVAWSVLSGRPHSIPIPLVPEDFSELVPFVDFVRDDPLALWEAPARLLFEARRARGRLPRAVQALRAPLLVALAGEDPICDNHRNRRLLHAARVPMELHEYADARHILEFSRQRDAFLDDVAAWLRRHEEAR